MTATRGLFVRNEKPITMAPEPRIFQCQKPHNVRFDYSHRPEIIEIRRKQTSQETVKYICTSINTNVGKQYEVADEIFIEQ